MASNKTSNTKKKARNSKNPQVVAEQTTRKKRKSTGRTRKERETQEVMVEEITEQISILEVVSDSAIAAKPFLLVFSSLFCIYLALALFSFAPNDIQELTTGTVQNWCGVLGVLLSTKLYSIFGYGAWVVLPLGTLSAWLAAGRSVMSPKRIAGVVLLYWDLLCVMSLVQTETTDLGFHAGGVIGHGTVSAMVTFIGNGGAWIFLSGIAVTLFIFVAGMELREQVERLLTSVEEQGPDLGHRSLNWGQEVLYNIKEWSEGVAENVRAHFQSNDDEYDWDDSFYTEYTESGSMFTDDGREYSEEDSLPPNSYEHSSEYEYSEAEHSEDYSYDYHTQEIESDVTRTQVQQRSVAQVEFSEQWKTGGFESTFDPNPVVPSPIQPSTPSVVGIQNDVQTADLSSVNASTPIPTARPNVQHYRTQTTQPVTQSQAPVSTAPLQLDDIDLPEDAWEDEDHSEWYQTATQDFLKPPRQRVSALPPQPLQSNLEIQKKTVPSEVGTVQANVASPVTPTAIPVQQASQPVFEPVLPVQEQSVVPVAVTPVQSPVAQVEMDLPTQEECQQPAPSSISDLENQAQVFKSNTVSAPAPTPSRAIPLPSREVTPAMGLESAIVFEEELEDESYTEETTPARVSVMPGNIESGGAGEIQALVNPYADFQLPTLDLLDFHEKDVATFDEDELMALADTLVDKLADFKVNGEVETICPGPVITTFEFKPARGVRVSKIATLADDIAMALKAVSVRIVAPIPGKDVVGIEIPNRERQVIWSRDMFASKVFQESDALLPMAIGKDVNGFPYVTDLTKTPHLLVAGTTGSGKSVGVNTMLISMLLRHSPETLRLILVDPKMLEFDMYNDIPHLLHPVVTDPTQASGILQWACVEMDRRYALMAKFKTRNIESYNKRLAEELADWDREKAVYYAPDDWDGSSALPLPKKMPYIVVVIDELADLMMVAGKEVEESIIRIAQKARACGIHLIVATQRPSADVITGLIKANMPSRMCFQVRGRNDSRIILDNPGGETLLGKGDMLFLPPGISNLVRCHGPFLTDDEVRRITDHLRAQGEPSFEAEVISPEQEDSGDDEYDDLYDEAVEFVCERGGASTSAVQRQFRIGYNRAARMIEQMERDGIISEQNGSKKRRILRNIHEN